MSVTFYLIIIGGGTYWANRLPELSPWITFLVGMMRTEVNASQAKFQKEKQGLTKKMQLLEKENADIKKSKEKVEHQFKMLKGEIDFAGSEDAHLESLYKSISDSKTRLKKELEKRALEARTCIICFENIKNIVLIPCGHYMTCHICSEGLRDCPVCRKKIQNRVKTFQ